MQFRCLLAGVAVLLCAAGCGDDGDDALPVTTTSAPASTTTTTAPTTSTTLDFDTEVKLAALELLELRNEVLMNPDPARVSEYIADTCVCLERERQIVEDLAREGRRWTGPAIEPLGIRIDRSDPAGPSFTLVARQPSSEIVGGDVPEVVPDVPLAPYHVSLAPAGDGGWHLNSLDGIPSMDRDVAELIIEEEGLP